MDATKTEQLTREEADAFVAPFVVRDRQYSVVSYGHAEMLLTEIAYKRLLRDPIRNKGSKPGAVYYWNVVDYVQFPELNAEKWWAKEL